MIPPRGDEMARFDFTKQAVLWDLDDTLYSRRDAAQRMFPELFRECLYENRSEEFLQEAARFMMTQVKGNNTHPDAFATLLERYPADKEYNHARCVEYYYAHIRDYAAPVPETVEILKNLRARGVKLAIVTNITPELLEHQHKKVAQLGIEDLFDAVVYSAEFGVHKPDRRIFDHAAALLGVANEDCLFVGDDPDADVTGALNAGMEAVWLDVRNTADRFRDDPRVHRVQKLSEYFDR